MLCRCGEECSGRSLLLRNFWSFFFIEFSFYVLDISNLFKRSSEFISNVYNVVR